MKRKIFLLLLAFGAILPSCKKNLDVPPPNIIQDKDVFGNTSGITAYMARIYSEIPMEDFKWNPNTGFKSFFYGSPSAITGEAISRDQQNTTETFGYWSDAYALIRECNYFLQTLPNYASNYSETQVNNWLGEVRFIRAFTYFALVKRYGGVPIVDKVLTKPGEGIDQITEQIKEYQIPRSSEEAVYDFIASDLDYAYNNLPETNQKGRASKYAAAALKSRAMLFAGSIAKYNTINLSSGSVRLCGIPSDKANDYFKAAYDAAALLDGKFSLYKSSWSATDKNAQAQNFANLFLDPASPENIFIREYHYPDAAHWYDANQIPHQLWNGGYSAETNPTLNFVEKFEGLPKNPDSTFKTLDADGHYILYNNIGDAFANAEPRLKGTIIFPGDVFKGQAIDIRRGIYTGPSAGGISKLIPPGSTAPYPTDNIVTSATDAQTAYTLPDGTKMNPAGLSGIFNSSGVAGCISGFTIRKYLDPNLPTANVTTNHSEQSWIEIRYAEVLLNQAEAAYELYSSGQSADYLATALKDINMIRERAGATLATLSDLNSVDVIRNERRKELAFENKIWWDLKRWRIIDKEQNNTIYRILNPFYSSTAGKYFFDDRYDERNSRYTFDPRWYYEQIPASAIAKSTNLIQNPGY